MVYPVQEEKKKTRGPPKSERKVGGTQGRTRRKQSRENFYEAEAGKKTQPPATRMEQRAGGV